MWVRLALVVAAGCSAYDRTLPRPVPRAAAPLSQPARLCVTERPRRPCLEADEVERWLARPDLEIVGAAPTPAGIQGARVLTVRLPGPAPIVFRVKWRAHSTASWR